MATKSGAKKGRGAKKAGVSKDAAGKAAPRKAGAKKNSAKKAGAKKSAAGKASSGKGGAKRAAAKKGGSRGVGREARGARAARVTDLTSFESLSTATVTVMAEPDPSGNECLIWRDSSFNPRVVLAVAAWAQEDPSSISPADTLGSLAKGVPWEDGPGQQARLVQAVNLPHIDVFAPFPGRRMDAPSTQFPASTTVAQWTRIVWQHQTPRTACFFKIP